MNQPETVNMKKGAKKAVVNKSDIARFAKKGYSVVKAAAKKAKKPAPKKPKAK